MIHIQTTNYDKINVVEKVNNVIIKSDKQNTYKIIYDQNNEIIFVNEYEFNYKNSHIIGLFLYGKKLKLNYLHPEVICEIFVEGNTIFNPYFVYYHIFNLESYVEQAFVSYLNKTITLDNKHNEINIDKIILDFGLPLNKKYKMIFMQYIANKKIPPHLVNYKINK